MRTIKQYAQGFPSVEIRPQGESNFFALLQGEKMLGEVQVNGEFSEDFQIGLIEFALGFIKGVLPATPYNAVWEGSVEENRFTLVSESNNQRRWLLVLTI